MRTVRTFFCNVSVLSVLMCACCQAGDGAAAGTQGQMPSAIQAIFDKPLYKGATWGLRVVTANGRVLIDYNPQQNFFLGSVRKCFSVGELLNEIGPDHTYNTPVYRTGAVDSAGVLHGDLILVASGDLTMGGRTNPDGSIAVTNFDHNEADSLGNAELTAPDPTAGYAQLAQQIAAAGIKKVAGDVIVDDRLWQPWDFRGQFKVSPIFVNDDVVDLTINPNKAGTPASVTWRPTSAAFRVDNALVTSAAASAFNLKLTLEFPQCLGAPNCAGSVSGDLPVDFKPAFTNKFPLVQVFRIANPANYARTILIEKLQTAGVSVDTPGVAQNAVAKLPARNSYVANTRVAELKGLPYADYAKFILKVSYNIGADTSLVLYGLTQKVDNMADALAVEQNNLTANYSVPAGQYHFVDGSGGGASTSTTAAVTQMLSSLSRRPTFPTFLDALPNMGIDGSLGFVTQFESDPTLAGAKGHVHAKPGTYAEGSDAGMVIKGQAFGGYIDARSGVRLIYEVVVNNVPVKQLMDLMEIFQDQGTVSAILWRDN